MAINQLHINEATMENQFSSVNVSPCRVGLLLQLPLLQM